MPGERQKQFLLGTLENLPGLSFLILSRLNDDLRLAGWVGTLLATMVCAAYLRRYLRPHPILLGINLFMVVITPLIELLHLSGQAPYAQALIGHLDTLVLGSILVTGVALTVTANNGFLAHKMDNPSQARNYSLLLLAACATGVIWSVMAGENRLISLALPLSLLFGLQQYFSAGAKDNRSRHGALIAAPGAATASIDPSI